MSGVLNTTDVSARIVPRMTGDGIRFAEILHTWRDGGGVVRHAFSRVRYALDDTPHQRAIEVQNFLKRRVRHGF